MALLNKLIKASKLALNTAVDSIEKKSIENKIKKLDKKYNSQNPMEHGKVKFKQRELKNKLAFIQNESKIKKEKLKKEIKREILISKEERKEEVNGLTLTERIQKTLKELPVVTLADDLAEGASGIEKVEELVLQNPNEPFVYLILAEALKFHHKTFLTINGLKAPFDLIGTTMDVASKYAEKYIYSDRWTFESALKQAINLGIKEESKRVSTLIVIGKSAQLLSEESKETFEKENYKIMAEKYLKEALEKETVDSNKGEILYYLAFINQKDRASYMNYLKKAISVGFVPALDEFYNYINKNYIYYFEGKIRIPMGIEQVKDFRYSYKKQVLNMILSGGYNMISKQGEKISKVSERIFDTIADKLIK